MLHFPELLDVRAGLAVVDVNDQDRFVSYLVFYAETFDIDDSNTSLSADQFLILSVLFDQPAGRCSVRIIPVLGAVFGWSDGVAFLEKAAEGAAGAET